MIMSRHELPPPDSPKLCDYAVQKDDDRFVDCEHMVRHSGCYACASSDWVWLVLSGLVFGGWSWVRR